MGDYINNIKIFLPFIVILPHCAAPFSALPAYLTMTDDLMNWGTIIMGIFIYTNASYFMGLFFFYSGYFVPKSYDKKGRYDFLFDRVKRLGIPFVVYTFVLGPYLQNGLTHVFFGLDFPAGTTNCGPTWFLNTLMTFSIIYAFACGKNWSPKIDCPSLLGFFGFSILTGALVTVVLLFANGYDFFFGVPLFWQDFPHFPFISLEEQLHKETIGWTISDKCRGWQYTRGQLRLWHLIHAPLHFTVQKSCPLLAQANLWLFK